MPQDFDRAIGLADSSGDARPDFLVFTSDDHILRFGSESQSLFGFFDRKSILAESRVELSQANYRIRILWLLFQGRFEASTFLSVGGNSALCIPGQPLQVTNQIL